MKKYLNMKMVSSLCIGLALTLSVPKPAKADLWGGDVVVLVKILANAIAQLQQMKQMVGSAQDSLNLARDLNRGINEVLNLMKTAFPESDLGIYKDWDNLQSALKEMESIYGSALSAKQFAYQGHLDQSVAEAILLYNSITKHSKKVDIIGENVKAQSRNASPKGAVKLQAQVSGVQLHVANQSLRTQGAILKLEAQNSALRNKQQKDEIRFFLESADKLKRAMEEHEPSYDTPRF
ncbi:MAG: hypothetical protein KDC68_04490 [Gelidibacter sp.]|nr:hypothetical protein [Gelidibacter sp.]